MCISECSHFRNDHLLKKSIRERRKYSNSRFNKLRGIFSYSVEAKTNRSLIGIWRNFTKINSSFSKEPNKSIMLTLYHASMSKHKLKSHFMAISCNSLIEKEQECSMPKLDTELLSSSLILLSSSSKPQ